MWDKAPKPSQRSLEGLLCDCLLTFLKDCARATYCLLRVMLSSPNSSMMQELLDQPFFLNLQVNNHKQHFVENGKIGFQKLQKLNDKYLGKIRFQRDVAPEMYIRGVIE